MSISNSNSRKDVRQRRSSTSRVLGLLAFALILMFLASCAEATDAELSVVAEERPTSTSEPQPESDAAAEADPGSAAEVRDAVTPTVAVRPTAVESTRSGALAEDPKPTPDTSSISPSDSLNDPTATPVLRYEPVHPEPASPEPAEGPDTGSADATATTAPAPDFGTGGPIAGDATPPPLAITSTPTPHPEPVEGPTIAPTPRPTPGPISRQTNFVPLDEPAYVTRENASSNITNTSYVLGVVSNGEARAYPLDMMWYHHIANDTVGGEPWLVTY